MTRVIQSRTGTHLHLSHAYVLVIITKEEKNNSKTRAKCRAAARAVQTRAKAQHRTGASAIASHRNETRLSRRLPLAIAIGTRGVWFLQ